MTSYRYILHRDTGLLGGVGDGLFVMLNPSTADERQDDPTIRRCTTFARNLGWARYRVVNLFAMRATDPADLVAAVAGGEDIVGPMNDEWLAPLLATTRHPIAAWGAPSGVIGRLARDRALDVLMARPVEAIEWRCLGVTADGSPRHPLFVPTATNLSRWDAAAWAVDVVDEKRKKEAT